MDWKYQCLIFVVNVVSTFVAVILVIVVGPDLVSGPDLVVDTTLIVTSIDIIIIVIVIIIFGNIFIVSVFIGFRFDLVHHA